MFYLIGIIVKLLCIILFSLSCLHAMDRNAVHSSSDFPPIINYWRDKYINTLSMHGMDGTEASLYCYLHNIAQYEPELLLLTPQQLTNQRLPAVYKALYAKSLPRTFFPASSKPLIVEEAARTIEGILNTFVSRINLKNQKK